MFVCYSSSSSSPFFFSNLVPINGHWGRWGPWSKCSRNCGQGYQTQSRTCDDPKPEYGGKYCKGPLVRIRPCMMRKQCK